MVSTRNTNKRVPHPADIYAGKMLRRLRICKGLSQNQLGNVVGLTFQQIQKYERGENRMSVSRIYQFCETLKASPMEFFSEELEPKKPQDASHDSLRLMRLFASIHDQAKRNIVITVAEGLANQDLPSAEETECEM